MANHRCPSRSAAWPATDNDYEVVLDGQAIGRIYETLYPGGEMKWHWVIYEIVTPNRPKDVRTFGTARDLDEAKRMLASALERIGLK